MHAKTIIAALLIVGVGNTTRDLLNDQRILNSPDAVQMVDDVLLVRHQQIDEDERLVWFDTYRVEVWLDGERIEEPALVGLTLVLRHERMTDDQSVGEDEQIQGYNVPWQPKTRWHDELERQRTERRQRAISRTNARR